ncbi:MAG: acetyl-CoA carboxylase biotin carboxylase subunit [Bacteroidetes bacterium]|nr:acetyl-CoA carboxylase biotin carboxylase subunit [Bacteroidota bacterium]
MFKKILVANRGEIALRVMRTAREMGISTVAVYSEADRGALHVRFADEAICLGPAASSQSYLRGDKIIAEALRLGVEAIHPGYGFLSENAAFCQAVTDAGMVFIGPTPHAIEIMGDKLASKRAVAEYNVPMVPGTPGAVSDPDEALRLAAEIGYPVLIKASAGGGGKGMRVVERPEDLKAEMARASSEAASAFGNGAVFVEKFVTKPRHVEVQVLGDTHGNVVHLFERECSIQRRHQKVIEEAPSAILTPELRAAMGASAVAVAQSVHYTGAGTVEFLMDADHKYYFLEMNTRLQVEHPITELITGIDLVREQINIAAGKPISFRQEDLRIHGHALELRVYAEDPTNRFLPDVGTLHTYRRPQGPGIRLDDGFEEGMEIPIHYDPMIAKLCAWGANREQAIDRMLRAIAEYRINGVKTTLAFGAFAIDSVPFRTGDFDTKFVEQHFDPEKLKRDNADEAEIAALLAARLHSQRQVSQGAASAVSRPRTAWQLNRS